MQRERNGAYETEVLTAGGGLSLSSSLPLPPILLLFNQ